MDTSALLSVYAEHVSPDSRSFYVGHVRRYLAYAGSTYAEHDTLMAYIAKLLHKGDGPNSVRRVHLPAIRRFLKVNNHEWPLKRWELPEVGEQDIYAPALSDDVIASLIHGARTEADTSITDCALLALSTVYGLRRIEMAGIGPASVNRTQHMVHVQTAKHGRARWHIIPEPIREILYAALPQMPISPVQVSKAFLRLENLAGFPHLAECGFHSIRRTVTRALVLANIPEPVIHNFMRWKRKSDNMVYGYFSTTVVGRGGTSVDHDRKDVAVDEQVFAVHPYLEMWR